MGQTIRHTSSVCPVCLKRLPADIVKAGADYYLEKTCPDHGAFSAVVWRGDAPSFEDWCADISAEDAPAPDCPTACGLCKTICVKPAARWWKSRPAATCPAPSALPKAAA
jgi:uncharacterized radical SAM superfamily Fe-S cluster-containing enzyme